jgi:serine/threonine-protein kinase
MSVVYRGADARTGREVAVKVLAPHLSADPAFRRRLLAEARAVARLPHPHIVRLLAAGPAQSEGDPPGPPGAGARQDGDGPDRDGVVALVLELVPGEALDRRLARGPLSLAAAVEVAAQVADALAFAHGRGIVHRDVKPHNILLTRPPEGPPGRPTVARPGGAAAVPAGVWAKLADFGIARALDSTTSHTAPGQVLGSAPYIAPEALEGAAGDARADVYSLGATLFEALAGRLPFPAATPAEALAQRLTQDAPPVGAFRPDVPPWLDTLVARCLERDPDRRVESAAALAAALRQASAPTVSLFATTTSLPRTPPPVARAAPPAAVGSPALVRPVLAPHRWRRPRRPWALAGVALASLLVATGGLARARSAPAAPAPAGVTLAPTAAAVPPVSTATSAAATATGAPRGAGAPRAPTPPVPAATPRPALETAPPAPPPADRKAPADRIAVVEEARARAEALRGALRQREHELRERAQQRVHKRDAARVSARDSAAD